MARLDPELLERAERFAHRVVDVADALAGEPRFRRVVDQLTGCGTSVGANTAEADEALSRADFCRILGITLRELSECRFWVRFIAARGWVPQERLAPLSEECLALRRIFGAMVSRVRRNDADEPASEPG